MKKRMKRVSHFCQECDEDVKMTEKQWIKHKKSHEDMDIVR